MECRGPPSTSPISPPGPKCQLPCSFSNPALPPTARGCANCADVEPRQANPGCRLLLSLVTCPMRLLSGPFTCPFCHPVRVRQMAAHRRRLAAAATKPRPRPLRQSTPGQTLPDWSLLQGCPRSPIPAALPVTPRAQWLPGRCRTRLSATSCPDQPGLSRPIPES
jgi:hypothetical protein